MKRIATILAVMLVSAAAFAQTAIYTPSQNVKLTLKDAKAAGGDAELTILLTNLADADVVLPDNQSVLPPPANQDLLPPVDGTSAHQPVTTISQSFDSDPATEVMIDSETFLLVFPLNSSVLNPDSPANAKEIARMKEFLASHGKVRSVGVISHASPEGTLRINSMLSERRAESAVIFMEEIIPYETEVVRISGGEWFDGLKEVLLRDYDRYDREKVINILNTVDDGENLKNALYSGGISLDSRNHIIYKMSDDLRSAIVRIQAEVLPQVVDTMQVAPLVEQAITLSSPEDLVPVWDPVPEHFDRKVPAVAISTNLLYDAVTAVNFGIDIPIGDHWTVRADYMFPWWVSRGNDRALEILHLDIGARYYFGRRRPERVMTGWFATATAGFGYYDIEPNGKGYQGEEFMATLGGGYSFLLGKNWSLDLGVGFGPVITNYRYYEGSSEHKHLIYQYDGRLFYFGPTSLKVGLTYLLHLPGKNVSGHRGGYGEYLDKKNLDYYNKGADGTLVKIRKSSEKAAKKSAK